MDDCGSRYEWLAKSSPPHVCDLPKGHEGEHVEEAWIAWAEWKPHWSVARVLVASVFIAAGLWLSYVGVTGPESAFARFGTVGGISLGMAVTILISPKINRPRPRVLSLTEHWELVP